jgi:hypothetical protein
MVVWYKEHNKTVGRIDRLIPVASIVDCRRSQIAVYINLLRSRGNSRHRFLT